MGPHRNLIAATMVLVVAVLLVGIDPGRVAAAAPPANDTRAAATVVSALPFSETVDVSGATRQKSDPGACYNDILARWARTMYRTVWYRVPAPGFDTLVVSVTASTGRPVIAVGRESGGRLVGDCQYTGRSDATGFMSYVEPTSEALVVVGLADDVPATLDIEIRSGGPHAPTNDAWQDATPIEQTPFVDRVDMTAATGSPDDPTGCGTGEHTIWYRIRPAHAIRLEVWTSGSAPSVQILRRVSGSFTSLRCVASGTESSDLEWTFAGGVTTYIMVGNDAADPGPPGDLTFTIPNDPVTPTPPWATSPSEPSSDGLPATSTIDPGDRPSPPGPAPWSIAIVGLAVAAGALAAWRRARPTV